MPGNIRYVRDFPTSSFVIRTARLRELAPQIAAESIPAAIARAGELVVYTPEAFVAARPAERASL